MQPDPFITKRCPACSAEMEQGYLFDSRWANSRRGWSIFHGSGIGRKRSYEAFRCRHCLTILFRSDDYRRPWRYAEATALTFIGFVLTFVIKLVLEAAPKLIREPGATPKVALALLLVLAAMAFIFLGRGLFLFATGGDRPHKNA